jgi:uracil-DNA glycosylase
LVGGESRIRPTQEMWRNSIPAFSEIISNLNPLQILVLGKANWSNLLTHIEHVRIDEYMAKLKVDGIQITAVYINHPSSSLSYSKWQPIAKRILV